jgi:hypothetical protein
MTDDWEWEGEVAQACHRVTFCASAVYSLSPRVRRTTGIGVTNIISRQGSFGY